MYKLSHEPPYISECIKVPYIVNEYNGYLFPYFLVADYIKYVRICSHLICEWINIKHSVTAAATPSI